MVCGCLPALGTHCRNGSSWPQTFKPLNTREHFASNIECQTRPLSLSPHLVVKIPLDVQLLVLGAGEGEAAGQVHPLLPPVLEDTRARDVDIGDAATPGYNDQKPEMKD